jgi:hypothetical protein
MRNFIIALFMISPIANATEFENPLVSVAYDQPSRTVMLVGDVFAADSGNEWSVEGFNSDGFRTLWTNFQPTTKRLIEIGNTPPWCLQATVRNGSLEATSNCIRF